MKIPATVAMLAITLMARTASARNIAAPAGTVVPVCMEGVSSHVALFLAEGLASKMFATASVTIQWRAWEGCPADGIRISLSQNSRPSDHPHAYAYAMPYEGTHIVLFLDRIEVSAGPRAHPFLLAHVLVHEITHILERTCRHSDTGVLKAVFTQMDIGQMEFHPLPFAPEDLELIHSGMRARTAAREQAKLDNETESSFEAVVTR
jgi:hypothetical protein